MCAKSLYDEKVFKTHSFQYDFAMALDKYIFFEFSGNWEES